MGTNKGSNTTTSTYTPAGPAYDQYINLLNKAQGVASTPYTPYTGELTAPINQQQQQGIAGINANANYAQPYLGTALQYAQNAAQPITAQQIQQYQNPFTQSVINSTQAQFNNQNAQQQEQLKGNAIAQGALGGNRVGIAQAELANQQQLAQAPVIANLQSQGYNTGLNTALTEQQAMASGAANIGSLGIAGQNAGLTGANAQIGAGTLQQQTQQAQDQAQYQQFLNQLAYPFQTTQWQAGIDTGVGSQLGGTNNTTQPAPSPWSQIGGAALGGIGLLGGTGAFGSAGWLTGLLSDERAKENIHPIGKLNDGQTIYRFNYKGNPTTHVGLIAQNVERHHPEAVGQVHGLKTVDYDAATRDSVRHRADGGQVQEGFGGMPSMPYSGGKGFIPSIGLTPGNTRPQNLGAKQEQPFNILDQGKNLGALASAIKSGIDGKSSAVTSTPNSPNAGIYAGDPTQAGFGETYSDPFAGAGLSASLDNPTMFAQGGAVGLMPNMNFALGGSPDPDAPQDPATLFAGDTPPLVPGSDAPKPGVAPDAVKSAPPSEGIAPAPAPAAPTTPAPAAPIVIPNDRTNYGDAGPYAAPISNIESGGKYDMLGPLTRHGDRAYGKYQVMGANIPTWTEQVLGKAMTPQEFLKNPQAQDAVFKTKFGEYVNKYGPSGAARAWFAGEGGMNRLNRRDQLGTSVAGYERKFNAGLTPGAPAAPEGLAPAAAPEGDLSKAQNMAPEGLIPAVAQADDLPKAENAALSLQDPNSQKLVPPPEGLRPPAPVTGDRSEVPNATDPSIEVSGQRKETPQGIDWSGNSKLWPALMTAGFGMMASRSPFPGVAFGEGALAGVGAYSNLAKQEQAAKLTQSRIDAEARKLSMEANKHEEAIRHNKFTEQEATRGHDISEQNLKEQQKLNQQRFEESVRQHNMSVKQPFKYIDKDGAERLVFPKADDKGNVQYYGYDPETKSLSPILDQNPFKMVPGSGNMQPAPGGNGSAPGFQNAAYNPSRDGIVRANNQLVEAGTPVDYSKAEAIPVVEKGMEAPEPASVGGKTPQALKTDAEWYLQTGKLPSVRGGRSPVAIAQQRYKDAVQNYGGALAQSRGVTPAETADMWRSSPGMLRFILGADGRATVSLGTAVRHLDTVEQLARAWGANDIQTVNKLRATLSREFGQEAGTNLEVAGHIVGPEIIKALGVAGAGTADERDTAAKAFGTAASPAQLLGAVQTTQKLLAGQLEGKKRQALNAGVSEQKFRSLIGERPYELLSHAEHPAGAPAGGAPAPRQPSPADQQALEWLRANPNHPKSAAIRQHLESLGIH